ncbi:Hypothetical predicted protein [Mytilus galloprovincialis]|uniref:Jacalin-type lectin domain-containing protein n=1 Tax=Mytilus galloprovincialis TaxID=29158 RepID=A0A8B6CUM9_MYTGA|nr:Hypothetical predicted protein [Mytilus galloprovincialis]
MKFTLLLQKTTISKKLLNQTDEYVVLHSGGESSDVHPKILGMVSKYFNSYFEWHMDVREIDLEENKDPVKDYQKAEFCLDKGEVVTAVDLYLGCLVKDLSFKTNFGREIGPFGKRSIGPCGFQRKEMSRGEHSYLHSLRCTIVQLRYSTAISCLNFAWITYPCDEFKEKNIGENVMEVKMEEYISRYMRHNSSTLYWSSIFSNC